MRPSALLIAEQVPVSLPSPYSLPTAVYPFANLQLINPQLVFLEVFVNRKPLFRESLFDCPNFMTDAEIP